MKKIITITLLLVGSYTQAQRFDWVTSAGYAGVANASYGAVAIARDSEGNIYTIDGANGKQTCQGDTAVPFSGGNSTFLYKFNASGKLQYIKPIGENFFPINLQVGENDNLYLLGALIGNNKLRVNDTLITGIENRNYILKFDTSGKLLWTALNNVSFGGHSAACMFQYYDNHIYFQTGNLSISKLDTTGKFISTLTADSFIPATASNGIYFKGSGALSNGDLAFSAISKGTITYDTITLVPTGNQFLETAVLTIRTNKNLSLIWANYTNGLRDPDQNYIPMTAGNDNGIYIGLQVVSSLSVGSDTIINSGGGSSGIGVGAILKMDADGNKIWLKSTTNNTHIWNMLNNPDGSGVFCGGQIFGFQPVNLGSTTVNPVNGNSFITKIDYSGTFQNSFSFASGPGSFVRSLATNNSGDFYVGGKLFSRTVPTFSCTPREANTGLFLGKFTEEPDVAPQPAISLSGIELTASPVFAGSIQWYFNGDTIPGATNQSYTAAENGDYSVSYSFIPSCVSTSAKTSVLTVGLSENKSNRFAVYPNPSNGLFTLQINGTLPEMDNIEIYNLYGEKVYTEKPKGLNTTIDLSDKARGVYFYKITSNKQVLTTGKIVVQ
ncbi:MAG: T9SS type A sorting domain-containing protein [Bacteroidales bacterium]|nr:T9SS type A sorting domain-containing protein [Bacteroidales bacterium]